MGRVGMRVGQEGGHTYSLGLQLPLDVSQGVTDQHRPVKAGVWELAKPVQFVHGHVEHREPLLMVAGGSGAASGGIAVRGHAAWWPSGRQQRAAYTTIATTSIAVAAAILPFKGAVVLPTGIHIRPRTVALPRAVVGVRLSIRAWAGVGLVVGLCWIA